MLNFSIQDFTENRRLFKVIPPVIKVEARQFPVTVHFNKITRDNYIKEAFNKIVKIHTKLPEGGVLVFVTGQQEVNLLVKKLRKAFPLKNAREFEKKSKGNRAKVEEDDSGDEIEDGLKQTLKKKRKKVLVVPEVNLDDYDSMTSKLEQTCNLIHIS